MLHLHSIGHFHPEEVLDNSFFEQLDIGTTTEWIEERTGIRTRRTVLPLDYIRSTHNADPRAAREAALYSNAQTGAQAATMALQRAGLKAADIGMVIAGGCSPEHSIPAEACTIANALGIEAPSIDVNSACSTFGAQLHMLSMMREDRLPDFVLLVQPENNTCVVDYRDRKSAILWGDGTAAAIVSLRAPGRARCTHTTLTSSPRGWDKVVTRNGSHFTQEGSTVQTFAIRRTTAALRDLQQQAGDAADDLYFVGHQANRLMLEGVCRRCSIAEARHLHNVTDFGNTGAAGAPIVLSQNWDRLTAGDRVAMVVVGSGLTWSSVSIEIDGGVA